MNDKFKFMFPLCGRRPLFKWSDKSKWVNERPDSESYAYPTGIDNEIIVVDIDSYKWKDDNHIWFQTFGKDYINTFDTFTVQSARGGIHLYFKYLSEYKTVTGKDNIEIDIRTEGGYIIAPGSIIGGKPYVIVRDTDIKEMPEVLKEFLRNHVMSGSDKPAVEKRAGDTKDIQMQNNDGNIIINDGPISFNITYDISKDDIKFIISKLPSKYCDNFSDWIKFTTFCKILNVPDLWKEYSMKSNKYKERENNRHWNKIDKGLDYNMVDFILKQVEMPERLPYYKYKKIPIDNLIPDVIITKEKMPKDFLTKKSDSIVLKSDTGTGKTTCTKENLKETGDEFVSICNRVTLCFEQYKIFNLYGIDCQFYKYEKVLNKDANVVIQLDSILRTSLFDYSKKVLFLDEFNSTVNYLISSPTIANNRVEIFRFFVDAIKECKRVVCVDADISEICIKLLKYAGKEYKYVVNKHQHNKNTVANELETREQLIEKLNHLDKFIVCCDSKTECQSIADDLIDKNVKVITSDSDNEEFINLDAHNKVIYSPKITNGLDSLMRRQVFAVYKQHTISPELMIQQINRCRDIIMINYLFLNKRVHAPKYKDYEDCKKILSEQQNTNVAHFQERATKEENEIYFELLSMVEYKNDCYNVNKFYHFKQILRSRGVNINEDYYKQVGKKGIRTYKESVEIAIKNFNKDSSKVKEINEYLRIPDNKIEEYKEYFVDQNKLAQHYNICNYFLNENFEESIKKNNDFKINYVVSIQNKLTFLKKFCEKCNIYEDDDGIFHVREIPSKEISDELSAEYAKIYPRCSIIIDFLNMSKIFEYLESMHKDLFGKNIIETKRITKNKIRLSYKKLNRDLINANEEIYHYRSPPKYTGFDYGNLFDERDELEIIEEHLNNVQQQLDYEEAEKFLEELLKEI